ncbi:hypothetical protein TraAM80_04343 [Trypanosoma rangeli]|uniref:Uncharacterized protein n=1 Tax=Trypanosoma rangeli TaxID=5698 RepID=A0A422NJY8_TRYRA|nr:uncharacterized protein TraAM80_04343 [Trypanosoma rangeli]RNF05810.1 hypothetical protein TraAM80_04343 [Trypanosoma rangeli]|eukprot:RNF05810.1 hypothetical protein TraAM80_04343 [Trypanosoma rangeli]
MHTAVFVHTCMHKLSTTPFFLHCLHSIGLQNNICAASNPPASSSQFLQPCIQLELEKENTQSDDSRLRDSESSRLPPFVTQLSRSEAQSRAAASGDAKR